MTLTAPPGPPGAPEITEMTATSCMLSWEPPQKDGGAPITAYIMERKTGTHWIQLKKKATSTQFKVTDLQESNKYEFRIKAENKAGVGEAGPPSRAVLAKDPYGKYKLLAGSGFVMI